MNNNMQDMNNNTHINITGNINERIQKYLISQKPISCILTIDVSIPKRNFFHFFTNEGDRILLKKILHENQLVIKTPKGWQGKTYTIPLEFESVKEDDVDNDLQFVFTSRNTHNKHSIYWGVYTAIETFKSIVDYPIDITYVLSAPFFDYKYFEQKNIEIENKKS